MCTPQSAFASVAEMLAGVDPRDEGSVQLFYTKGLRRYSTLQRRAIQTFLVGLTAVPDDRQKAWLLARVRPLRQRLARPMRQLQPQRRRPA